MLRLFLVISLFFCVNWRAVVLLDIRVFNLFKLVFRDFYLGIFLKESKGIIEL